MKKVNKQCLIDTPRTVRVSEKTWQVIVRTRRPSSFDKKISVESVQTKIVPSKAVVGVDRPMKAPSMHIQKPNKGKIV